MSLQVGIKLRQKGADEQAQALRDCNRAIELKPDYADAYFKRASLYRLRRDYQHAIADYTRTIELQPDWYLAFTLRGIAYMGKGEYDRALADCSFALKQGYTAGGLAQDCIGKADAARKRLAAGQKLGDPRAWCDGRALAQEGFAQDRQIEGCTLLINSGQEEPGDLLKDYFNRATAYDFERTNDKAIADYNMVIRMKPDYADAYGSLGMIYWVKNEYDLAIANFDKAIALSGSRMDLYFPYRGRSHFARGDFALAIADFDSAIERDPASADAFVARSFAFNGTHDYDRAIADADQAIKLSPLSGATEAFDSRGDAHFHQGDFTNAMNDYDQALKLWPGNPQALYGRGAAKNRKGDATGGQADMNAARKLKEDIASEENRLGIGP